MTTIFGLAAGSWVDRMQNIWQNCDRDYNTRCLVKRLHHINKEMSGDARDLFAAHTPGVGLSKWATGLLEMLRKNFTSTMATR